MTNKISLWVILLSSQPSDLNNQFLCFLRPRTVHERSIVQLAFYCRSVKWSLNLRMDLLLPFVVVFSVLDDFDYFWLLHHLLQQLRQIGLLCQSFVGLGSSLSGSWILVFEPKKHRSFNYSWIPDADMIVFLETLLKHF